MEKQGKTKIVLRVVLLLALVSSFGWSYYLFNQNYKNLEKSHGLIEAVLRNKTQLAQQYATELGLTQESLAELEKYVGKLKKENAVLREKIKLLDKMSELEADIKRLKEKNALLVNQMSSSRGKPEPKPEPAPRTLWKDFKSIEEGKQFKKDQKKLIKEIDKKIAELKRFDREQKKAAQREMDQLKLRLGNNGFLVRDGDVMPPEMPEPSINPNIQIDVQFVK